MIKLKDKPQTEERYLQNLSGKGFISRIYQELQINKKIIWKKIKDSPVAECVRVLHRQVTELGKQIANKYLHFEK